MKVRTLSFHSLYVANNRPEFDCASMRCRLIADTPESPLTLIKEHPAAFEPLVKKIHNSAAPQKIPMKWIFCGL